MSDSIYDLKQSLFTSNLPVQPQRDRASEKGPNFDQALNSAQQQSRDEHRASNSPPATDSANTQPKRLAQAEDSHPDEQDQVTLSEEGSKSDEPTATETKTTESTITETTTAETTAAKPTKATKKPEREHEADETAEGTTDQEIAAVVASTNLPPKPVLKELTKNEPVEQQEGIELNDAVQPDSKRAPVKTAGKEPTATIAVTKTVPVQDKELAATNAETPVVDPYTVVADAELQTNTIPAVNKNERGAVNKPEQTKAGHAAKAKPPSDDEPKSNLNEHAEGTFAVSLHPKTEGEEQIPKRRIDSARQSAPEALDSSGQLQLSASFAGKVGTTANNATPGETAETTMKTADTPAISAASPTPTETPTPPNHLRNQTIPNSFANRLEAAAAERKAADGTNGVDRARFVQRVARAFQRAGENEGEIRLRLSPPELGTMKLEVTLRDGAMIARMETETTTARNLLMDNLPQLKEKLAEQNIRIETFEVEVRDQANHSSADDAQEQLRQQSEQQRNRLRGERATTPVVAAPIVRTLPAARQSSQLNVVI